MTQAMEHRLAFIARSLLEVDARHDLYVPARSCRISRLTRIELAIFNAVCLGAEEVFYCLVLHGGEYSVPVPDAWARLVSPGR